MNAVIESKETNDRKLNFELLRIVSMFLIVIYHYSDWGGLIQVGDDLSTKLIGDFLNIGGKLGVNIFVLISGYFLIDSKFKIKKLIKVIFEVWLYSVGIALVCMLLKIGDLSQDTIVKSFLPIMNNMYWFATAYVVMYVLSPFINKFIRMYWKRKA